MMAKRLKLALLLLMRFTLAVIDNCIGLIFGLYQQFYNKLHPKRKDEHKNAENYTDSSNHFNSPFDFRTG